MNIPIVTFNFLFTCMLFSILFMSIFGFYIKQNNKINILKTCIKQKTKFKSCLLNKNKNLIRIEFRPGIGGREALSWSTELLNTYKTFFEKNNCAVKEDANNSLIIYSKDELIIKKNEKKININLYDLFKNESGIHQVKRIPLNESKSRIHSSTATVAVFLHEHINIKNEIKRTDLKIKTFRSSKPGGQNVNKVESGVSILYKPLGIHVECQKERTQELNKQIAMKQLSLKINKIKTSKKENAIQAERAKQVKDSSRSNKIRTYNFFKKYIIDHVKKKKYDIIYFEKAKLEFILNL
ncbi:peptide chain release factor 1, putative [Hepatocystis sp. ex Piliocolobus tephrosceles]|nr:peptide chain release factor 1, putative [Hepatocystis sp. ex Piliocolobus tephrosceles]